MSTTVEPVVGYGAVANSGPTGFYGGADNNLWRAYLSGTTWDTQNLGLPSGSTGLSKFLGLDEDTASTPELFFENSDGNVWRIAYVSGSFSWTNLSTPTGVSVSGGGGSSGVSGHYQVVILGSDGNLWRDYWNGSAWTWQNMGKPSATVGISYAVGSTVSVSGGSDYVQTFVVGTDGNLWRAIWNGTGFTWADLGVPSGKTIKSGVGADCQSGIYPQAYIIDNDGNLWRDYWNGSVWTWANLGIPVSGTECSKGIGVGIAVSGGSDYPGAFVEGTDGNVWHTEWNGSTFAWINLKIPDGKYTITSIVGAPVVGGVLQAFLITSDNNMWNVSISAGAGTWVNTTNYAP